MSLGAIWSGNFHQLRSSFGSNPTYKLIRLHSRLVPAKVVNARRSVLQHITAKVQGQNEKAQSNEHHSLNLNISDGTTKSASSVNSNKSKIHVLEDVQFLSLQQDAGKKCIDWPATILVFDIETTGFSPYRERIIEFASRDLTGGKNSTFQTLVNPGKTVTNDSIHGITSDMVNRPDVPRFEELIPILLKYVKSRQINGKPVLWIGHNAKSFDVPFVMKEFDRCSCEIPEDWLFLDTLPLARQLSNPDGSKLASLKLGDLREHYRIPLVGPAHRAMQDVTTLSYVLQRITFDLKLTIPELISKAFRTKDLIKAPAAPVARKKKSR